MENQNKVITVIRLILEGYQHQGPQYHAYLEDHHHGKDYILWDCDYLLNQIIRKYDVPWDHYYYSKAFMELWTSLGYLPEERRQYNYHKKITVREEQAKCFLYNGSNVKPYNQDNPYVKKGDSFAFRDAFHLEHIIPISHIISMLAELEHPTDEEIEAILDQIYVARITKEEDRRMHNKNKRASTLKEVYHTLYQENGITLFNEETNKPID